MIGSSPQESANETWGVGEVGLGIGEFPTRVLNYNSNAGWSLAPRPQDHAGQPLAHLKLFQQANLLHPSPLDGQMTPDGSGVLAGSVGSKEQALLVRKPGGAFKETAVLARETEKAEAEKATVEKAAAEKLEAETAEAEQAEVEAGKTEAEKAAAKKAREEKAKAETAAKEKTEDENPVLKSSEELFGKNRAPLIAPVEEEGANAGAFLVPVGASTQHRVLHWDGKSESWSGEKIETTSESGLQVLGIGATSPANAWMLVEPTSGSETAALYRRHENAEHEWSWRPVTPHRVEPPEPEVQALEAEGEQLQVPGEPEVEAQALTVTSKGVWVDGRRHVAARSTTVYFEAEEHNELRGAVKASWCAIPVVGKACTYSLPEELPTGAMRSFAWANISSEAPYGERVITGFNEGVSLRLDGSSFTRVLALGGTSTDPPGGVFGAAFSSAKEGWLGEELLPVHLTLQPQASRLTSWPVSFRHTLLAVAPQPGVPIGALSSEAVAVGDLGEVARYEPGKGWMPESLLGPGGRHESPRLRAVAWPTPQRTYAVGDKGEMWLWRGETGLWEKDPATPVNFIGNLLGVAFDPNNASRGYAVGAGGVLLRYGKTWRQETGLPAQVVGASFTSIAFAGSEAIVTYRQLPDRSKDQYVGGLLVNEGSGWHVDESAEQAAGSAAPWTVAGLADGGAAFSAGGSIYERSAAGEAWHASATPLPGGGEPGSLALFRENGELRVIAAGTPPDYYDAERVPQAAPGSPPTLIEPYALLSESAKGLLRQTASGWSDEEHELNDVQQPGGNYSRYDTVYQPDPLAAVLINPTGNEGWAVGGFVEAENHEGVLDTADVDRYPADGTTPAGAGTSSIPAPGNATFAFGGGAQCAAPCADRARARIGPDVWLQSALSRAGEVSGARAFLYTGPRLSTFETSGAKVLSINYERELARYAQLLAGSPLPSFAAASPTDLNEAGTETTFKEAFSGFPAPFGGVGENPGLAPAGRSEESCAGVLGCQTAYYAFTSVGSTGTVRVIVLDNTADVAAPQREWLAGQLRAAAAQTGAGHPEPAIVVGNADLSAQVEAKDEAARRVTETLIKEGASAYFYDAPERNVKKTLSVAGVSGSLPAFGSGTLGYVSYTAESSGAFLGASGFLLGEIDALHPKSNNVASVTVRLIPNIGELALEAKDGTLLRRSQLAEFAALARRPRAGNRAANGSTNVETDPYIPIPSECEGAACAERIVPEYAFTSSRTDIGDFVERNTAAAAQPAVEQDPTTHEPIHEQVSKSGLFCAFNAGTTTVTISAGGLSASLPVTVQAGSVRQPCGTVPLKELPAKPSQVSLAPPPPPAPVSANPTPTPASTAPLIPVPLAPTPAPPPPVPVAVVHPPTPLASAPFLLPAAVAAAPLAFVPPPLPTPARPTPPSGTSPVTSPIEVAEHEEEEEEATESVGNQAVAYSSGEHEPSPAYILGVIVLAAFAGASIRRRPRRGQRPVQMAPAGVTATRRQRQLGREAARRNNVTKW